jgi:hypothetical protein
VLPPDALAQAAPTPEAGAGEGGSFNPQMFGDLIGITGCRTVTLRNGNSRVIRVPVASSSGFKISDNESPRPVDRVFFTYNYFDGVNRSANPSDFPRIGLNQGLIGFEKTFLNGDASFGMRMPYLELNHGSDLGVNDSQVGDLSMILKLAWINDRSTGNVLSSGIVATAPTGKTFTAATGERINPWLFQPFIGYIWNVGDDLFVHGFTSVEFPSESRDLTIAFTSIGVGFWAIRNHGDGWLTGVVPTLEIHFNDPLNHRGSGNCPVGMSDIIDVTGGVHILVGRSLTISSGITTPLSGPRPDNFEAILQANWRF